jgi:hypothetical protein
MSNETMGYEGKYKQAFLAGVTAGVKYARDQMRAKRRERDRAHREKVAARKKALQRKALSTLGPPDGST